MKSFFVILVVSILFFGCRSQLQLVNNWREIVKERELKEKPKIIANVGATLFHQYVDNVFRFDCLKNDEPIFFPEDLIEKLNLQPGYFIPANQIFCNISTYDCESGEFYFEIMRKSLKELANANWCNTDDSVSLGTAIVYLKVKIQKKGNYTKIENANELLLFQSRLQYRYYHKNLELPNNVKLTFVVQDSINYNIYFSEYIFGGVQGNDLIVYFREYYRNSPNESHSYTLYYNVDDIKRQRRIKFKDAELEIIDFDNQSITYRVVK